MPRENFVMLFGQPVGTPKAYVDEDTGKYEVSFTLKVLRRNGHWDYPPISVGNMEKNEAQHLYSKLQSPIFVCVKGVVFTTLKPYKVKCEECGQEKDVTILTTEVAATDIPLVIEEKHNPEEFKEFSNIVHVIGRLCNAPANRGTTNNTSMTQYQIAIDRKFRIPGRDDKTDFPWIKSFGPQADSDKVKLFKNAYVYVSGAFQTRNVTRVTQCEQCQKEIIYKENVGEIVSNDVEYLRDVPPDIDTSETK